MSEHTPFLPRMDEEKDPFLWGKELDYGQGKELDYGQLKECRKYSRVISMSNGFNVPTTTSGGPALKELNPPRPPIQS